MTCKNCHTAIIESQNFCAGCGAKMIRHRLTLKNLWREFVENVWNIDNTFFRTYRTLFTDPELVINGYIGGLRKKYVKVFSYYAIALTLAGIQLFILRKWYPTAFDLTVLMPEGSSSQAAGNVDWVYDYYSILALLNLPFYALIAKLVFIRLKKYNYVEHLVINTYLIAQYTITNFLVLIVAVMLGANFYVAGSFMNVLLVIYFALTYKKLYPLSWKQLLLRLLWFLALITFSMFIFGLIQALILMASGNMDAILQQAADAKATTP